MSKTAVITGGIGDCMYAIPIMKLLGVETLYIKENFYPDGFGSMYTAVKGILHSQGITALSIPGGTPFSVFPEGLSFDYDLDAWRCRPRRNELHIIKNMMLHYQCYNSDWNKPFLKEFVNSEGSYNLIFLTQRWREGSTVDWSKIRFFLELENIPFYFIGFPDDHKDFVEKYGPIKYWFTKDLLRMADLISNCKALYCNQSVALTLAQGLGKKYFCEFKPNKTNTRFFTANENVLA